MRSMALAVLFGSSLLKAQTGGIQGMVTVVTPGIAGATAVSVAHVFYHRVVTFAPVKNVPTQLAPGEVSFDSSAVADASGNHKITGLPAGTYVVCAKAPGQPFLDPCDWALAPSVPVTAGAVSTLNVQLQRGVYLDVRINDSQGLAVSSGNLFSMPHLVVGVIFGTGAFLSAGLKSTDATGQSFEIAVPTGAPLKLWLYSQHVALADAQGKVLNSSGTALPFTASPGANQSFTINVTGKLTTGVAVK